MSARRTAQVMIGPVMNHIVMMAVDVRKAPVLVEPLHRLHPPGILPVKVVMAYMRADDMVGRESAGIRSAAVMLPVELAVMMARMMMSMMTVIAVTPVALMAKILMEAMRLAERRRADKGQANRKKGKKKCVPSHTSSRVLRHDSLNVANHDRVSMHQENVVSATSYFSLQACLANYTSFTKAQ
jgi:hypothetical protein